MHQRRAWWADWFGEDGDSVGGCFAGLVLLYGFVFAPFTEFLSTATQIAWIPGVAGLAWLAYKFGARWPQIAAPVVAVLAIGMLLIIVVPRVPLGALLRWVF